MSRIEQHLTCRGINAKMDTVEVDGDATGETVALYLFHNISPPPTSGVIMISSKFKSTPAPGEPCYHLHSAQQGEKHTVYYGLCYF